LELMAFAARRSSVWQADAVPILKGSSIRRACYNKAHDLEHGFHTPALLG
jgi:hypothetical protein